MRGGMVMEWEFWSQIVGGLLGLLLAVVGYVVRNATRDLRELQQRSSAHGINLAEYKTHVSEHFAKKEDLNAARLETKDSLGRLHDRLDEVGRDIKSLLRGGKHGGTGHS